MQYTQAEEAAGQCLPAEHVTGSPQPATQLSPHEYEFQTRSFAPFKLFGGLPLMGGYAGNNRGFETSEDVTSKMVQTIGVNVERQEITFQSVRPGDVSVGIGLFPALSGGLTFKHPEFLLRLGDPIFAASEQSHPTGSAILTRASPEEFRLSQNLAGFLPLTRAADIDVHSEIDIKTITEETDSSMRMLSELRISGRMFGDAFPNAEILMRDPSGQTIFLHGFQTEGGKLGPYWYLPGDNKRPMGEFQRNILLDNRGNFLGVRSDDKLWTLRDWNAQFLGKGGASE